MCLHCGQTNIPSIDENPIPCSEYLNSKCILYVPEIPYLGLGDNTPVEEVIGTFILSLMDARNRIQQLESNPPKYVNNQTGSTYQLVLNDYKSIVTFNNTGTVNVTIPEEVNVDFPIGTEIDLINLGSGVVNIIGSVSIINIANNNLSQGESATIVKVDIDTWVIKK